jgi:hydrogenase expression/formation protein HypC
MCLAVPAKVLSVAPDGAARAEFGGVEREISVALLDDVRVGDYVIVHVGCAISKIDENEARRTLALFGEMARLEWEGGVS